MEEHYFVDEYENLKPGESEKIVFERIEYDTTDYGCQLFLCLTCPLHFLPLFPGVLGTKRFILDEEEAVEEVKCALCSVNTRRPYGELGSVDKMNVLCCVGVNSELSKKMPVFVGWGCDDPKVSEIVAELKRRMKARGDTGQIQKADMALQEIKQLRTELADVRHDMKALLAHLQVPPPSKEMKRA
jgi:hypothetical protein